MLQTFCNAIATKLGAFVGGVIILVVIALLIWWAS